MPLAIGIAVASGCIVHDALFVALAECEDRVVAADEKLSKALNGTPYAERGVNLKDVAAILPSF